MIFGVSVTKRRLKSFKTYSKLNQFWFGRNEIHPDERFSIFFQESTWGKETHQSGPFDSFRFDEKGKSHCERRALDVEWDAQDLDADAVLRRERGRDREFWRNQVGEELRSWFCWLRRNEDIKTEILWLNVRFCRTPDAILNFAEDLNSVFWTFSTTMRIHLNLKPPSSGTDHASDLPQSIVRLTPSGELVLIELQGALDIEDLDPAGGQQLARLTFEKGREVSVGFGSVRSDQYR